MVLLILKSSACLAVLMVFYKLLLEKESIHHFKRFYLLGALLVSIVIPFITFTQYINIKPIQDFTQFQPLELPISEALILGNVTPWQDYISTILWSIYFIGALLFSLRFALNLKEILHRIKNNPKQQYHAFTNVLLQDLILPHTFFNYIFLNKTKFENNLIPKEVLLHEQTHAKQIHTIDIVIIELLQIVFWFNPLIYLIKREIKLNHEFLADQAVLNKGVTALQYKETLLAFSSNAKEPKLANAINYSSIKKRFTVMKTQTSKQTLWLKSLILIPILGILIYSCSNQTNAENTPSAIHQKATPEEIKEFNRILKMKSSNPEKLMPIKGKELDRYKYIYNKMNSEQKANAKTKINTILQSYKHTSTKTAELTPEQKKRIIDEYAKKHPEKVSNGIVEIPSDLFSNTTLQKLTPEELTALTPEQKKRVINEYAKKHPEKVSNGIVEIPSDLFSNTTLQKATKEQIATYNTLAKKINANPKGVFKQKDITKVMIQFYNLMSETQKKKLNHYQKLFLHLQFLKMPHLNKKRNMNKLF